MVIVLGSAIIRPGSMAEALKISLEHVHRSRTEPGCHSHSVHQDCENADRLVFVEEWKDQASLQQHFNVPESGLFVKALTALTTQPPSMVIYECTNA